MYPMSWTVSVGYVGKRCFRLKLPDIDFCSCKLCDYWLS